MLFWSWTILFYYIVILSSKSSNLNELYKSNELYKLNSFSIEIKSSLFYIDLNIVVAACIFYNCWALVTFVLDFL